jgi:hypothetical protein
MHRPACAVFVFAAITTLPRPACAQSATWPRVELGGHVSFLSDGESVTTVGPKVFVNLNSRTAIAASADFQVGPGMGFQAFQGNHNFLFVGVRRALVTSARTAGFITGGLTRWWYDDEVSPAEVARIRAYYPAYAPTGTRNIFTFGGGVRWEVARHVAVEVELDGEFNGNYNFARFTSGVTIPIGSYPAVRPDARKFAVPASHGGSVPSDQGVSVQTGRRVWATLADGREVTGHVASLSATALELMKDGHVTSTPLADVRKIEQADSNMNGLWIGAAAGAGAGFVSGLATCAAMYECSPGIPPVFMAIGTGIGGLVGWVIDKQHVSRETVYVSGAKSPRLTVAPIVTPRGVGAGGTVCW